MNNETQKDSNPQNTQKVLKYQLLINQVVDQFNIQCPPKSEMAEESTCYRFIFQNDPNGNSHKPGKVKSPKRKMPKDVDNCSLCGLSCYNTEENATAAFKRLIASSPNLYKNIGDSLAFGDIDFDSGIIGPMDEDGHFDLFEYSNFDPISTFHFLKLLITNDAAN